MSYGSIAYGDGTVAYQAPQKSNPLATFGNTALALIALACAGTLYANLGGPGFEARASLTASAPFAQSDEIALPDPDQKTFTVTAPPIVTFAERFFSKADEMAALPSLRRSMKVASKSPALRWQRVRQSAMAAACAPVIQMARATG